ncbi:MAG: glycosyltransferase family A protein [Terriglobales bacterium]
MPTAANATPKVSVIIPSYQTAPLIARCLDTVMAQTFQDFEAIVVNDGSPDTPELEQALQPYLDRIVYVKQENKRCAGARNTAIGQARGEFLAFLDSDDTWYPEHLASQMQQFGDDPTLDLVYCDSLLVGDPERESRFMERCPSNGPATFESLIVERCQIPISTVVARKQAIVKAGGFDEKLLRCDDYDMWVRTAFSGAKIGYIRKLTVHMYIGRPGSMSQEKARMVEAYWGMLERFKSILPLSEAQREVVEKRAEAIRTRYLVEEGKRQLGQREFGKARELFTEANRKLRAPGLTAVLFGLKIAPKVTSKLVSLWGRFLRGLSLSKLGGARMVRG